LTLFNKAMTGGRGFIALAAFYFGGFRPGPTAIACFVFGFFEALQYRVQQVGIPPQLIETLPYLSVVLALASMQIARAWRKRAAGKSA
jgi:simple sugar transport system permease protein